MGRSRSVLLGACAALLMTSSACSREPDKPTAPHQVRLYGSDGNMSNSFGDEFKDKRGVLGGMKGTVPLTPLSADFKGRLMTLNPKLKDFGYSAESYDAVMISAIATELAGVAEARQIARYINGVTTGGTRCETALACLTLAREGRDLRYRGVSLRRGGFTDVGEPAAASYATLHFDRSDKIDDGKTEFVGAGDEATTTKAAGPAPRRAEPGTRQDPLIIGGLLPRTGDLAYLNAPMVAGVQVALKELNAAGGVFGQPVSWIDGDDGTDPAIAKVTVTSHISKGVQVIIGAAASGVSREVLPTVVAAGMILFSPSNTAADLTRAADNGLYFRTAPSDLLQGKALADVILRDGSQKIAIVARSDSYGEGLLANVRTELEKVGIPASAIKTALYCVPKSPAANCRAAPAPPNAPPAFSTQAGEIAAFAPDGVLVIGYAESASVIKQLVAAGIEFRH